MLRLRQLLRISSCVPNVHNWTLAQSLLAKRVFCPYALTVTENVTDLKEKADFKQSTSERTFL